MTHTPGPWKADLGRVVRFIPESHGGPMTETVAICSGECEGSPLDNARLMAAAPEMFAAIRPLIDAAANLYRQIESVEELAYHYQGDLSDLKVALFDAKQALTKVRGE